MEELLRRGLNTSVVKAFGGSAGGCISQGQSYETDRGLVFVKINSKPEAKMMFDGEAASLEAIQQTYTLRVPKPITVLDMAGGGALFVMEHLKMSHLHRYAAQLGEEIANLHLHNQKLGERLKSNMSTVGKGCAQDALQPVEKFGFHTTTCCGYIPQRNDWQSDWATFFTHQRLQTQMDLIEKDYGDRKARELWAALQLKIPEMFKDMEIVPALLHGDLWGGNVAEDDTGPIVFDPASFYGHSEFELAIAGMFGGFGSSFFSAYHNKIPKAQGFEQRQKLYQLFNYLNHWNHFGTQYRGSSLNLMRKLLQ
uniref:protein-ribulosamine 3-kinase n=1 Tax=Geotrypetes seraphini TaxID=260995 RepID=A0A6P8STX7_GEOSA|nr:ketosamine-3-kinase-like isoform X1 [Geotrypetes seraphini]